MNILTLIVCIISTLIVVFMIFGGIWVYFAEKKNFNHGICPRCGRKLKCIDMDSQGGRWYVCSNRYNKNHECDYDCWVSYDVDKF